MPVASIIGPARERLRITRRALLMSGLLAGCVPPDTTTTKLIGHGGMGPDNPHPMNSREALLGALAAGRNGVELDVQLTADSVLVAHHDLMFRCGDRNARVNDLRWSDLRDRTKPGDHHGAFQGVRVDTLLALAHERHPDAEFTLDVKLSTGGDWWDYLHAMSGAIAQLQRVSGLEGRIVVECKVHDFLRAMAMDAPDVPTYLYTDDASEAVQQARSLGCVGVTIQADRISTRQAEEIHAAGLALTVFGVDGTWSLRRALRLKPDRIQID